MKKISCIGWCNADDVMNYGQILQGMALMKLVNEYPYDNKYYLSYLPRGIKSWIKCIFHRYNPFSGHLFPYIRTSKIVNNFAKKNDIHLLQINSYKELCAKAKDSNVLICGSDQLWHPSCFDKGYFLDIPGFKGKKYSYAVSLPKTQIEEQYSDFYKKIKEYLKSFYYISVREKNSISLIKSLGVNNVTHSLDPTLLVEKCVWDEQVRYIDIGNEPYIFVYIPNGVDEGIDSILENVKRKYQLSTVFSIVTRGGNKIIGAKNLKYVDIGQFLYLIKNSSFVITTSFHAVVFSIIFKREFLCYDYYIASRGEDIRLKDLLSQLELDNRIILNNSIDSAPIDYSKVDYRLDTMRNQSKQYLNRILG